MDFSDNNVNEIFFVDGAETALTRDQKETLSSAAAHFIECFDIDDEVAYAELDLNHISALYSNKKFKVAPIPQFPFSKRDYAILIDNKIGFNSIKEKCFKINRKLLFKIDLFDVYNGKELPKNKKSYGISFYFYNKEKTITDSEINIVCDELEKMFINSFGAELR